MKHGARDVSAFLMSTMGSGIVAGIVFLVFDAPCPELAPGVAIQHCVWSMPLSDFAQLATVVCLFLGFVAAGISEFLPDDGE